MHNRREILTGGALAVLGGGFLSRVDKVAGMQRGGRSRSLTSNVQRQATGTSEKLLLPVQTGEDAPPKPADYDRLPLSWNKRTVRRFKRLLRAMGIEAFLVRNPLNIIYLTGYNHTTTERPQGVFMNTEDTDPWFFYPGLDRDIVTSWWFGGGKMYFDMQHAEGAFPHEGKVQQGAKVDLFKMMLEGLKDHGIQGNKIGVDGELYPSELAKIAEVLPGIEFVDVSDVVLDMRINKTPEELALWSRAYIYFDRAHAFARDYILTHGTDITDYEVKVATELWINDQLYSDLDLAGGIPHHGVNSAVGISCRVGQVTGYPHPNQPYFNRIGRNMALQISGVARIGGYGHENYRAFIIADSAGNFDPHMQKLWQVSKDCCDMQMVESVDGVTCSSVAYKIHKYQVAHGVEKYVYHRPAHGAGVEGHQPPYIALGDYTMLKKDMCFSEEPGLYDPDNGCGFNWSNTIVVGNKTGYRMSRVPYSKEWCWLKI
ncbi:MAG: aminopeptidase P family protein [Planctomycetes bacterium]|nr:aminopeptidase P family protein [Planctomycetota bacterium]